MNKNPMLFLGCTLLAVATLLLEETSGNRKPRLNAVRQLPRPRNRARPNHLKLVASNGRAVGQTLRLVT